jgi:rhomboid protease GluP
VGSGMGLAATLTAAVIGNYINVYLHGDGHLFIGFSTAVFAIIGMLVSTSYQNKKTLSRFHVFLPFMAGAALLAMLGSSGEKTDLGAHLFGLLSGIGMGFLLTTNLFLRFRSSAYLQLLLFLGSLCTIYLNWSSALSRGI